MSTVLFLGGNGHAPARLAPAREALKRRGDPFVLRELPYPAAASFEDLLETLSRQAAERLDGGGVVYATGIGALVALALRARGDLLDHPVVLQGGVLWGLEHRWFPRVMRFPGLPRLLAAAFGLGVVRRRFAARHFLQEHSREFIDAFFAGYHDAGAFASWFDWLRPGLLRRLEGEIVRSPAALEGVEAWWGGRDHVVTVEELRHTERALEVTVPLRVFPEWGHYPMIDDPEGWVGEVARVVAAARDVP